MLVSDAVAASSHASAGCISHWHPHRTHGRNLLERCKPPMGQSSAGLEPSAVIRMTIRSHSNGATIAPSWKHFTAPIAKIVQHREGTMPRLNALKFCAACIATKRRGSWYWCPICVYSVAIPTLASSGAVLCLSIGSALATRVVECCVRGVLV